MLWTSKTKYFAMAACVLLVVTLMSMGRTLLDRTQYLGKSAVRQRVSNIVKTAEQAGSSLKTQESKGAASEAVIQKTFDLFKYRDVIPSLYQIIISALPNEENNPEQKELYEAFRAGDRDAVMKTARGERKQLFVTGMSIYFTKDVSTAQLGGGRGRLRTPGVPGEEDEEDEGGWASPASTAGTRSGQRGAVPDEVGPGFIVTMTGYSPYENIGELLDPSGVDNNKSRWGFVTRLMHLEDANDVNSPFKLYQKAKLEHFKLETGEVSYGDAALPAGTGVSKESLDKGKKDAASSGRTAGSVLVDPMTREVISKVEDLDEYGRKKVGRTGNPIYKVNDHWFVLNAKFFWKQAPKK